MEFPGDRALLRIGELSRRLGVSDHVLRAWESRYGLLQPVRSPGGFRLYCGADELRVRRMQAYLAEGLSAAEAARAVLGIMLNRNGWRINYLGANTPVEELERAVGATRPDLVVLAATVPETLEPLRSQLGSLARCAPLALAGAGAAAQIAAAVGARLLAGDPVTEAGQAGWPR
jgi:MerR HTH family regulatory protein